MWFENGGKNFRLTRNFYKENPTTEFLCEDDGEILDVAQGDLDAVLDGISETVYENTVSVAQLKSTTGPELVREVQNYMASYQGAGDSSVDLGRTMQMLKMARKGYQVQAEQKKRENQREKEKISSGMEYIRQELEELQEKEARVSGQEKSFYIGGDGSGIGDLETGIAALYRKQENSGVCDNDSSYIRNRRSSGSSRNHKKPDYCHGHWCDRHCGRSRRLSCENACI